MAGPLCPRPTCYFLGLRILSMRGAHQDAHRGKMLYTASSALVWKLLLCGTQYCVAQSLQGSCLPSAMRLRRSRALPRQITCTSGTNRPESSDVHDHKSPMLSMTTRSALSYCRTPFSTSVWLPMASTSPQLPTSATCRLCTVGGAIGQAWSCLSKDTHFA